eukprot:scaffold19862_cov28-Tisochrysis_lutea.AAC.2
MRSIASSAGRPHSSSVLRISARDMASERDGAEPNVGPDLTLLDMAWARPGASCTGADIRSAALDVFLRTADSALQCEARGSSLAELLEPVVRGCLPMADGLAAGPRVHSRSGAINGRPPKKNNKRSTSSGAYRPGE